MVRIGYLALYRFNPLASQATEFAIGKVAKILRIRESSKDFVG